MGIGLSILITLPAVLFLCIELIRSSFSKNHNQRLQLLFSIIFSLFCIFTLAQVQYWIPPLRYSFVVWIFWLSFSVFYFIFASYGVTQISLWVIISFLLTSAAWMNPRQYHNFFRASYYEDFIRRRYTELNSDVADMYIDRYKDKIPNKEKAQNLYRLAKKAQKLKDNDLALILYNESLDLDPDNSKVYFERGFFKLSRLELNTDVAYNAVKDFDRAIKLNPKYADAYFNRAVAVSYVGRHSRACMDYIKAKEIDPKMNIEEGLKKNCSRINNP